MINLTGFGIVLLFIVGGAGFVLITLLAGRLLRPSRPNEEKRTTYESGEEPVKSAWSIFNVRFYVIALIFLLFEAELVFLFPWATVFADPEMNAASDGAWGRFSLVETFIFIAILLLGLIYVWSNGMLEWVRPKPVRPDYQSRIPASAYDHINRKDYKVKKANGTS